MRLRGVWSDPWEFESPHRHHHLFRNKMGSIQATTLEGLFSDQSFVTIFIVILFTVVNILVGVSIFPQDKRGKGFKIHRILFYLILMTYGLFLWISQSSFKNNWFNYAILAYFMFVIPITRKINITFHAILASLGLILLIGVASFNVL